MLLGAFMCGLAVVVLGMGHAGQGTSVLQQRLQGAGGLGARAASSATAPRVGLGRLCQTLEQAFALLGVAQAQQRILLAVKAAHAIHPGALHAAEARQRRAVPENHIGLLAHFNAAHQLVHAQLLGGVDGHQGQSLLRAQAAHFHGFGRLGVQPPRQLGVVAVQAGEHASAREQGRVAHHAVKALGLEAPPVDEGAGAGAQRGNFFGHLVALQHMLEGGDFEPLLLGQAREHQDLVSAVAVNVNGARAGQQLGQGFQAEVAAAGGGRLGAVVAGLRKGVQQQLLYAHARLRVAVAAAEVALLDVLAQRELDGGRGLLEQQGRCALAPA